MNLHNPLRCNALFASLALVGLVVQGCASGPQPRPAAPVVHTPAGPKPAKGQMEPIPNPPEDQKSSPSAVPSTPRPSAKPAAPKAAPSRSPAHPPAQTPGAASTVTTADAARATKLRASGLEQLNRGAVDRAVTLLRQASQLDPGNELIQRDLERALRISQVVHAKP
jgi:hypothetical protein